MEEYNMNDLKEITEETDLSKIYLTGLDLVIGDESYDVYKVHGYYHTLGGRIGDNDYWACPAGETPTYHNLIEFNGEAPTWGITFAPYNRIEDEIESRCDCWITRNGQNFYRIRSGDMSYGLAKAQYLLVNLFEECALDLSLRDWKERTVGRKIWYNDVPAIITEINHNNELHIVVDGDFEFPVPAHLSDEPIEGSRYDLVDLLDPSIFWYRD